MVGQPLRLPIEKGTPLFYGGRVSCDLEAFYCRLAMYDGERGKRARRLGFSLPF